LINFLPQPILLHAVAHKVNIERCVIVPGLCINAAGNIRGMREEFDRFLQNGKEFRVRRETVVGKSDKDGPEGLPVGLNIAIKGMCQKTPPKMDAISDNGQNTKRASLNEGGT